MGANIRRNMIIGSILASAVAAFALLFSFRRRNKTRLQNGNVNETGDNHGNKHDLESAAESYIKALSELLEEAGISDNRDQAKTNRKEKEVTLGVRNIETVRNPREEITDIISELQTASNEDLLTDESVASIVLQLVGLKNLIDPLEKVDIRNIHFMNDGKHDSMVVELITSTYGAPAYDEELSRLWREIFPAENFWNADFAKVRINVKDTETGNAIETISCSVDDVKRYLRDEISEEQLSSRCKHRKTRRRKKQVS